MIVNCRRCKWATVGDGKCRTASIGTGLILIVSFEASDNELLADSFIETCLEEKCFDSSTVPNSLNVAEKDLEILCIPHYSQTFRTVDKAHELVSEDQMSIRKSKRLFRYFVERIGYLYRPDRIRTGEFGKLRYMDFERPNAPHGFVLQTNMEALNRYLDEMEYDVSGSITPSSSSAQSPCRSRTPSISP